MSNIKQRSWPWGRNKHTWLCCWRGQDPSAVHSGKLALQGGRGSCPTSLPALSIPRRGGGEQAQPSHSPRANSSILAIATWAACCSCLSRQSFPKATLPETSPLHLQSSKTPQDGSRHRLVFVPWVIFPFEGERGMAGEFKLCVARQGPGAHDGKTQLGRNAVHD